MLQPDDSIVRPLTAIDLAAVERIQAAAYPHYPCERIEVFADKLAHYPAGCWAFEVDGVMGGYLFSHPSLEAEPPEFDALLRDLPLVPDCYFIHDKSVAPELRGRGAGRRLLDAAIAHAAALRLAVITLVSVQGSRGYWERFGFKAVAETEPSLAAVRRTYGPQAHYMMRRRA